MTVEKEAAHGWISYGRVNNRSTGHIKGLPYAFTIDLGERKSGIMTLLNDDKAELHFAKFDNLLEGQLNRWHLDLLNLLQLTVTCAYTKDNQTTRVLAISFLVILEQGFSHLAGLRDNLALVGRLQLNGTRVGAHAWVARADGGRQGDGNLVVKGPRVADVHSRHHRGLGVKGKVLNVLHVDYGVLEKRWLEMKSIKGFKVYLQVHPTFR